MTRIRLKGVHRVTKRLASGGNRQYHYAFRGGPLFWRSDSGIAIGSAAYLAALSEAAPKAERADGMFRSLIIRYMDSAEFKALAPRTQKDFRVSLNHQATGIDAKFGSAPLEAFNDPRIRARALRWRDEIAGKTGDTRIRHLQQIVSWSFDRGYLDINRLTGIKALHKSNRAEIFWTDTEIDAFVAGAPAFAARILIAATETGLRPGDLVGLSRFHVKATSAGRRIEIITRKRGRLAAIPVTERMGRLIDSTPPEQPMLMVGERGRPFEHENYLGAAVSKWRDRINASAEARGEPAPIRQTLRLYDARGTAATRLLRAGAEIREIATAMSWSIKAATQIIERYVALHPDMTDQLGAKIARLEKDDRD